MGVIEERNKETHKSEVLEKVYIDNIPKCVGDYNICKDKIIKECDSSILLLCKKDIDEHQDFVIKICCSYDEKVIEKIREIRCYENNLLPIIEAGFIPGGLWYQVLPYYPEGDMTNFTEINTQQFNKLVKDMNIALKALHDAGLVHNDIKPSNILFNREKDEYVLCDYDCCTLEESDMQEYGTMYYRAYSDADDKNTISNDYGSLGITLLDILTSTIFFEGCDIDTIKSKWKRGIEVDRQISAWNKNLIKGLTNYNSDKRWGYKEVESWCQGIYLPYSRSIKNALDNKTSRSVFEFGYLEDENGVKKIVADSIRELYLAFKNYPDIARNRHIDNDNGHGKLVRYIKMFDEKKAARIDSILQDRKNVSKYEDILSVFQPNNTILSFNGKNYLSLEDLIDDLPLDEVDIRFVNFVKSNLFQDYIVENEPEYIEWINIISNASGENTEVLYYSYRYCFGTGINLSSSQLVKSYSDEKNEDKKKNILCQMEAYLIKMGYYEHLTNAKVLMER